MWTLTLSACQGPSLTTWKVWMTLEPISAMSLIALSPTTWPPYRMASGRTLPRMETSDLRTIVNWVLEVSEE